MKKKKIKEFLIKLKKVLGIRTLLFLIVLLSFNTYAWFIFTSKVDTGLGAKVRSWNIKFKNEDDTIVENVTFNIDDLYPGMNNFNQQVKIANDGDTNAVVTFELTNVRVLGTNYAVSSALTSDQLIEKLQSEYPFEISLGLNKENVVPNDSAIFSVDVMWGFETNSDTLDTYWGEQAYDYNHTHPGNSSIQIDLTIKIDQEEEND